MLTGGTWIILTSRFFSSRYLKASPVKKSSLAAVVGKTTPDIYANMWQGDVEDYARSGVLIPLDTLDGFLEFLYQRCDSQVVREITSADGHIYQVPWKVNPIMMMYNPAMFRDAGIAGVPEITHTYLEAGAKIKSHAKQQTLATNGWGSVK